MPRRPKWRGTAEPAADGHGLGCLLDTGWAIGELLPPVALIIGAIALVVFFVVFVIPALVFVFDVLFVLAVAAIGVALRVLFRRPWDVVARTDGPPEERVDLPVVGWRASGKYVDEVAWRIETTGSPLPALPETG
jgi:hypothetical protein